MNYVLPVRAVAELLALGGALDNAARAGVPVDVGQAVEVVDALSAYVASLPVAQQQETARNLVATLNERPRYETMSDDNPCNSRLEKLTERDVLLLSDGKEHK